MADGLRAVAGVGGCDILVSRLLGHFPEKHVFRPDEHQHAGLEGMAEGRHGDVIIILERPDQRCFSEPSGSEEDHVLLPASSRAGMYDVLST